MDNETDVTTAFEDILDTLPTALNWCLEHEFVDAPVVRREWYPPTSTFSYHTISAIDNADQKTLTEVAEVFFNANALASQPWYPAFLDGWSEPLEIPLRGCATGIRRGQACFDFGLRRPRFYNQLIVSLTPAENIRGVALRSIAGMPVKENAVQAFTVDIHALFIAICKQN